MKQPAVAARRTPAAPPHTTSSQSRPASLPRRALVSIAGTAGANLLTASLVGLLPTITPFPTAARQTNPCAATDRDSTVNTKLNSSSASNAAPATAPKKRSPEEQRRILHLEQSIRTRALIDDMVNSLE